MLGSITSNEEIKLYSHQYSSTIKQTHARALSPLLKEYKEQAATDYSEEAERRSKVHSGRGVTSRHLNDQPAAARLIYVRRKERHFRRLWLS